MDGLDEPTETYPLLSGAAGFAFQNQPAASPSPDEAAAPVPFSFRSEPDRAPVDDEPPTEEFAPVPPRRSRPKVVVALVGVAVLLGVTALIVTTTSSSPTTPVAGAAPAFTAGTFDLVSNVTELNLTLGRPAGGPIRASTPPGSGITPATSVDGTEVRLTARPTGAPGPGRLDVLLDERITWTIRMNGGVHAATFVLTGGMVRAVDLTGGADTVYLALPDAARALPIRMSGGVREWSIQTEGEVPVRVQARSGAGVVSLYGRRESGIARNTTLTAGDGSGLEVTAAAGFGSLAVSSR
uniref:hypothetical protein n=1 Tax=Paractinoplanes polyasparticus TaxID=2856853 RepID=UPI001C8501EE|nr:hypothetical protein [Actinoplanes polyasparticus]